MEAILDTNFIISCILKKIDFIEELRELGFVPILPREVLQEMKDLKKEGKTSHAERVAIDVAFKIFEQEKMKKISLGKGKVDSLLINKGREGVYIATLDREIKRAVPNRIVILGAQKKLGAERS